MTRVIGTPDAEECFGITRVFDGFDVVECGDLLMGLLHTHMLPVSTLDGIASSVSDFDGGSVSFWIEGKDLKTELALRPLDSMKVGVRATVVGLTEKDVENEAGLWFSALQESITAIHSPRATVKWNAIIGPLPQVGIGINAVDIPVTVGGMQLGAAHSCMKEGISGTFSWEYRLNQCFQSWPSVINGTSEVAHEGLFRKAAMLDLTRLCALISLHLDEPWSVRHEIQRDVQHVLTVPEYHRNAPEWIKNPSIEITPPKRFDISEWIEKSWLALAKPKNNYLVNAVLAFREGVTLSRDHPSISRVALISAIEAVANKRYGAKYPPCSHCGNIPRATEKFRQIIEYELGDDALPSMRQQYKLRSGTVHQAAIGGSERYSGGIVDTNLFRSLSGDLGDFELISSHQIRNAARAILMKELDRVAQDESNSRK